MWFPSIITTIFAISRTKYCYSFATINVVKSGERITLLAIPVRKLDNRVKIVEKLIAYAKKKVRIRRLYADRGFYSVEMINKFKDLGLLFLMPPVKHKRIAEFMKLMPAPSVYKDWVIGEKNKGRYATFNLILVEKEEKNKQMKKYAFVTNMEINENEVGLCEKLFRLYGRRWGIETSYRMTKNYLAKTTSKNYSVRLFYFLYATLLYNLWIIMDSMISIFLNGKTIDKHLITADIFAACLCVELHKIHDT